jgi:hypothetical protein
VEQNEIFQGKVAVQELKTSRNNKQYYRLKIEGPAGDLWFTAWPPVSELILSQPGADWRVQYSSQVLSGGQIARTIRKAEVATGAPPQTHQVQEAKGQTQQTQRGSISRGVAVNGIMSLAAAGGWFKDLADLMAKASVFNAAVDTYEQIGAGTYVVEVEPIEPEDDFAEVTI